PGTSAHLTQTKLISSERVAPEVALVVGALLFAERQMRDISDPARAAATAEMASAITASRQTDAPLPPTRGARRAAATYRLDVLMKPNNNFRIDVPPHLDATLKDAAGGLPSAAIATELLRTLTGPYRAFYREMLEAAIGYWRDRRPSAIESTWS